MMDAFFVFRALFIQVLQKHLPFTYGAHTV